MMIPLSMSKEFDLPVLPNLRMISEAIAILNASNDVNSPYSDAINLRYASAFSANSSIPKTFWITMKDSSKVPGHIKKYLSTHENWKSGIVDDSYMTLFMEKVFANTSVLWAYNSINPQIMAGKTDIWRYAVLYVFGGVYIDADAGFKLNLDKYLTAKDKFILSSELNPLGKCYNSDYIMNPNNTIPLWGGRTLIQWLMISSPQHPFIIQTLTNLVDIVKHEYLKTSVLSTTLDLDYKKFHALICSTGPVVFTVSVTQVVNSYNKSSTSDEDLGYRFIGTDFKVIGGKFKADEIWDKNPQNNYQKLMNNGVKLLGSYESS